MSHMFEEKVLQLVALLFAQLCDICATFMFICTHESICIYIFAAYYLNIHADTNINTHLCQCMFKVSGKKAIPN